MEIKEVSRKVLTFIGTYDRLSLSIQANSQEFLMRLSELMGLSEFASILVGALARNVISFLLDNLSQRPVFDQVRSWLRGERSQLVIEVALVRALLEVARSDLKNGIQVMGWSYIAMPEVSSSLARAILQEAELSKLKHQLAQAWVVRYAGSERDEKELTDLAFQLVDAYRRELRQDPLFATLMSTAFPSASWRHIELSGADHLASDESAQRDSLRPSLQELTVIWGKPSLDLGLGQVTMVDVPFVVRMDLDKVVAETGKALTIYPGESAIVLEGGRNISGRCPPGPLHPNDFRKGSRWQKNKVPLEVIVFCTNELDIDFDIEARDSNDERVNVHCTIRFYVENPVALYSVLMRGRSSFTSHLLHDQLQEAVREVVRRFTSRVTFCDLDAHPGRVDQLETALVRELERPVYRLHERGLRLDGLVTMQADNPARKITKEIRDEFVIEREILKTEEQGYQENIPLLETTRRLRNEYERLIKERKSIRKALKPATRAGTASPHLWRFPDGVENTTIQCIRSTVAVHDSAIYLADEAGNVFALDAASGNTIDTWPRVDLQAKVHAPLTIASALNGRPSLLVPTSDGTVHIIDLRHGDHLDRFHVDGQLKSRPLIQAGTAYFGCTVRTNWGGVVGLRLQDGSYLRKWNAPSRHGVAGTPVIVGETLYFATLDFKGETVFAADINSEKVELIYKTAGPVYASPVFDSARGRLYVTCQRGYVYGLDLSGKECWRSNKLEAPSRSTPVIVGNLLIIGDQKGYLYALDLDRDGIFSWDEPFKANGAITATPMHHNGMIIVGSRDGHVYVIDAVTGRFFEKYDTGTSIPGSLTVSDDGVILAGSGNEKQGRLDALPWHLGQYEQAADHLQRRQQWVQAADLWLDADRPVDAIRCYSEANTYQAAAQVAERFGYHREAALGLERAAQQATNTRERANLLDHAASCWMQVNHPGQAERCRRESARLRGAPYLTITQVNCITEAAMNSDIMLQFDVLNSGYSQARHVQVNVFGDVREIRSEIIDALDAGCRQLLAIGGIVPVTAGYAGGTASLRVRAIYSDGRDHPYESEILSTMVRTSDHSTG